MSNLIKLALLGLFATLGVSAVRNFPLDTLQPSLQGSAPSAPTSGTVVSYFLSSDGFPYWKNSSNTITGFMYSTSTLTNHGVLFGNGTRSPSVLGVCSTNTVFTGNTGADPSCRTLVNADFSTTAGMQLLKLEAISPGNIIVGSSGSTATQVAMSGAATINTAGVISLSSTIASGSCTSCNLTYGTDGRISVAANGSAGSSAPTLVFSSTAVSTTTWTVATTECFGIKAAGGGGGGGGGGIGTIGAEAGQGGQGSGCISILCVTPQNYVVVTPAGGAAGAASGSGTGTSGTSGASLTITDNSAVQVYSCPGGQGGGHGTTDSVKWYRSHGGFGGIPSCNTQTIGGTDPSAAGSYVDGNYFAPGGFASAVGNGSGAPCAGGGGGSGIFGAGGAGGGSNACTAGTAGGFSGGGGGGGSGSVSTCNGNAGGAGGKGGVFIYSL